MAGEVHLQWDLTENIIAIIKSVGDNFSTIADITGVCGFIITIFTLKNTQRISNALNAQQESTEFKSEGETIVLELESYISTMEKDGIYSYQVINASLKVVEKIEIYYPSPTRPLKSEITKTKKLLNECLAKVENQPNYNKAKVIHNLSRLAMRLRKLIKEVNFK